MADRYYFKCTWCERSFACECPREDVEAIRSANCPLCNEAAVRIMGRVEKSNIVREVKKPACDKRCTDAQGPSCNCKCNCLNHGSGKLVTFDKIVGKLSVVNAEMLDDNEIHIQRIKRMAEAKNKIKVKVITFLTYKNSKILNWLKETKQPAWRLAYEEYREYKKYLEFLAKIDKIEDLKSIQKKINSLSHLIPKIGDTLQYLEALSFDKEQKEQKAVA